jgi:hypothetical protein
MECPICTKALSKKKINDHVMICIETLDTSVDAIELTTIQKKAIEYCKTKSRILSAQIYDNVIIKGISLGHEKVKIEKLLSEFSNKVELSINFHFAHLAFFLNDGVYKNIFETGKSSGCSDTNTREIWENNLFGNIYSHDCDPSERVKYGALHLFNEQRALSACNMYGDCAMILKSKVKNRTSYVYGDSSGMQFQIGTIEHSGAILNSLHDSLLDNLIKYYNGDAYDSSVYNVYIEVQIHGILRMMHDVEKMYIPSVYNVPENKEKFEQLFEKFGIVCYFF